MNTDVNPLPENEYPEWCQQPQRLTLEEIKNPGMVITDFFETYNLLNIRECLHDWLNAAIRKDEVLLQDYVFLHRKLEKLIEAIWVEKKCNIPGLKKEHCENERVLDLHVNLKPE